MKPKKPFEVGDQVTVFYGTRVQYVTKISRVLLSFVETSRGEKFSPKDGWAYPKRDVFFSRRIEYALPEHIREVKLAWARDVLVRLGGQGDSETVLKAVELLEEKGLLNGY